MTEKSGAAESGIPVGEEGKSVVTDLMVGPKGDFMMNLLLNGEENRGIRVTGPDLSRAVGAMLMIVNAVEVAAKRRVNSTTRRRNGSPPASAGVL